MGAIGYLTSLYPAVSHTFIYHEIRALRNAGLDIKTATIRPSNDLEHFGPAERDEYLNSYCVIKTPLWRILKVHSLLLVLFPNKFGRALRYALQLHRRARVPRRQLLAYFLEAGLVFDWMRRENIRHLHVHFGNPAATVALIAQQLGQITFSLSMHGPDIFDDVTVNILEEKFRRAAFIRCISRYCRSQSIRLASVKTWDRFHVVRCGIDLDQFAPRKDPHNAIPRIVCVGRLVPAKGQHVLLQACKILRDRNIAFQLSFIGEGPDRFSLERMAGELAFNGTVSFMGAQNHETVLEELGRADVMVLPSFAEGIPVVLMEAMARAVPCISTPVMGIPELIRNGENGLLASPADPADLADKMECLLTNAQLRNTLGRRARATVVAEYNLYDNCRQLQQLLAPWVNS